MTLNEIESEWRSLTYFIQTTDENGEISPETDAQITARFDNASRNESEKATGLLWVRADFESKIANAEAMEDQCRESAEYHRKCLERFDNYIAGYMTRLGKDEIISTTGVPLRLRPAAGKQPVDYSELERRLKSGESIDEKYLTRKEVVSLNKDAIRESLTNLSSHYSGKVEELTDSTDFRDIAKDKIGAVYSKREIKLKVGRRS